MAMNNQIFAKGSYAVAQQPLRSIAVKRPATNQENERAAKKSKPQALSRTDLAVLERVADTLVGLKKKKYIDGDDFDLALDSAERDPGFGRKLVAVSDPDERLGFVLRRIRQIRDQMNGGAAPPATAPTTRSEAL